MKRKLLLFVLLLAGLTSTWAAQIDAGGIVSIRNVRNIVPGYTGSFDVVLNNTNSRTFIAFGMDITLPEGFTYAGCAKGELLTAGHNLIRSDQGNNVSRFSSIANPNADFLGTEGVLMTVYFTVGSSSGSASVKVGLTYSVDTYNATLAQETLTVGNTITLSEDETEAPAAISGVDVTVNRTLKANVWNTICLPFAMNSTQIASAFGSDAQIAELQSVTYDKEFNEDEDEDVVVGVKLTFGTVTEMAAHHPYIIKVSSPKSEFSVSSVVITTGTPSYNVGTSSNYKQFIGTYTTEAIIPDGGLYLMDNKFKYSQGTSKLKAFRAYFYLRDKLYGYKTASAPAITLDVDGISTGISSATLDDKAGMPNEKYYTVQGLQVSQPKRGLYIVNGKKMIVK